MLINTQRDRPDIQPPRAIARPVNYGHKAAEALPVLRHSTQKIAALRRYRL